MLKLSYHTKPYTGGFRMTSITQDMKYRLSLIRYAEKYGVTKAAIKYKTNRQYIYRWKRRFDGSIESLRDDLLGKTQTAWLYQIHYRIIPLSKKAGYDCPKAS